MCRMIAKVSTAESSVLDEMLQCPYSLQYLSEYGIQSEGLPVRGKHKDGCGIAFIENEKLKIEKRTCADAWNESYIDVIKYARSKIFIAHNRKTSAGLETRIEGTHPFYAVKDDNQFAFCHNGTVTSLLADAKKQNTSDSKLFFENILRTAQGISPDAIAEAVKHIEHEGEYDSLCSLMINKNELFVWRIFNDKKIEEAERYAKYYTLYLCLRNNSAVISSEPLDDEPWWLLPNKTFLHIKPAGKYVQVNYKML